MTDTWPWPGDSAVVIARRVAVAYRSRLAEADPGGCAQLDAQLQRWGQRWAVPDLLTFELDDWLSPSEAAGLASVQVRHISSLRRRGRLTGRQDAAGNWQYQAREVIALSTATRTRAKRNAETPK